MSIPVVFIEGGIGCGKSTLVERMKTYCKENNLKYLTVQEPVDEWLNVKNNEGKTMIEAFYDDQFKYGFYFQIMAYITRLKRLQEAFENAKDTYDFIICERSLYTDKNVFCKMLYDEGKIDEFGYQIYNKWFDHFQKFLKDATFVYLKTDYKVCLERVNKRQRDGESSITAEYLKKNNQYHDNWLLKEENVTILDGNQDCENNPELLDEYCRQIIDTISYPQCCSV